MSKARNLSPFPAYKRKIQENRCGFLQGKPVVEKEKFWYSRLRATINSCAQMHSDILITARTDSRQILGFEEATERLKESKKTGADFVILEAIQSREECKKGDTPVLFNMVRLPGAGSPDLTVEEAKELGFRLIIFPGEYLSIVLNSCKESLALLKDKGREKGRGAEGVKQLFTIYGLDIVAEIDKKAGGKAYENV